MPQRIATDRARRDRGSRRRRENDGGFEGYDGTPENELEWDGEGKIKGERERERERERDERELARAQGEDRGGDETRSEDDSE